MINCSKKLFALFWWLSSFLKLFITKLIPQKFMFLKYIHKTSCQANIIGINLITKLRTEMRKII